MAELSIQNLLVFQEFHAEISPGVALITGENYTGKSSLGYILAALTSHDTNPAGLSAAEQKRYVNDRATEGEAWLACDGQRVGWSPTQGITAEAERLSVPHAVGVVDFTRARRNAKDRAELWERLFVPDNPEALLKPVWPLSQRQLTTTLERIRTRSWKDARTIYEDQRKEAKRDWEQATGKRYGVRVAASWLPVGWRPELEGNSRGDLVGNWDKAREELDAAKMVHAVDGTKIAEAKRVRDEQIPEIRQRVDSLGAKTNTLRTGISDRGNAMNQLAVQAQEIKGTLQQRKARLEAEPPFACPGCGVGLQLHRTPGGERLTEWTDLHEDAAAVIRRDMEDNTAALDDLRAEHQRLAGEVNGLKASYDKTRATYYAAQGELQNAEKSAALADAEETEEVDAAERSQLEQAADRAKEELDMWDAWDKSRKAVDAITEYDAILELLGPSGPRAKLLQAGMTSIVQHLKRVEQVTGWPAIRIAKDYQISCGGRPVQLTADSQLLMAQWACQLACGLMTGSKWIVLDKADTLRGDSWDGLHRMLNAISAAHPHVHVVLCATQGVEPHPDWQIIEIGRAGV